MHHPPPAAPDSAHGGPAATDGPPSASAAFRELHGRRLHAFALLLTLGDRPLAARLAAEALAAGAARHEELRHPERAAAWLRRRVVRSLPRRLRDLPDRERQVALEPLGIEPAVVDGLAALAPGERAALIATDVERLDPRDAETVTGMGAGRLERVVRRARQRYLVSAAEAGRDETEPRTDGPILERIRAIARRVVA